MNKENQFQLDAKNLVDLAFNNKLFKENVSRDQMNALEEYVAFVLQSKYDSYVKINKLLQNDN